jgi:Zn finger protein HypA/HybF involved in hydrogenase expression
MRKILDKEKAELVSEDKDTFECAGCHMRVSINTLACPRCGQLHCQHCGAPLPMGNDFTGKCPRCEGFQNFETAELVVTKVEDIPPEERFWEELPSCSKCGAAVQADWDDCPFCGTKVAKGKKGRMVEIEPAADKVEGQLESAKEVQKKLRKEKKKDAEGV